jgi:hypothetical protein
MPWTLEVKGWRRTGAMHHQVGYGRSTIRDDNAHACLGLLGEATQRCLGEAEADGFLGGKTRGL